MSLNYMETIGAVIVANSISICGLIFGVILYATINNKIEYTKTVE